MTTSLPSLVEDWSSEDWTVFLRLLGEKLEQIQVDGELTELSKAVYGVTRDLTDSESDAASLDEEIENDFSFQDALNEELQTPLMWMEWPDGLGMVEGFVILDFGSDKVFTAHPSNEDLRRSGWHIRDFVEREDPDALRAIVTDYIIELNWIPDSVYVTDLLSRSEIEDAYAESFDHGYINDWDSVVMWLAEKEPGVAFPIRTEHERAACLAAYLDRALGR